MPQYLGWKLLKTQISQYTIKNWLFYTFNQWSKTPSQERIYLVSLIIYESGTGIDTLQKKQNVASSMSGDDMIIYQYETKLSETK